MVWLVKSISNVSPLDKHLTLIQSGTPSQSAAPTGLDYYQVVKKIVRLHLACQLCLKATVMLRKWDGCPKHFGQSAGKMVQGGLESKNVTSMTPPNVAKVKPFGSKFLTCSHPISSIDDLYGLQVQWGQMMDPNYRNPHPTTTAASSEC